jgi:hypothetical protein
MKKRIIQLLLIERCRIGMAIIEARKVIDEGKVPPSELAAIVNSGSGKMAAWLWTLREMEPSLSDFYNLIETFGMRADDAEIVDLAKIDQDLLKHAGMAGEMAAISVRLREEEEA